MKKFFSIIFICAIFSSVSAKERIVNGNETAFSWKNVPALLGFISPDSMYICSGVLIDPKIILTAGHCVFNQHLISNIWATGGKEDVINDSISREFEIKAEKIELHPDYKGAVYGNPVGTDLAMILLSEPILDTDIPRIISSNEIPEDAKKIAVGWGTTSPYSKSSGIQREGEVSLIKRTKNGSGVFVAEVGNPSGLCSGDSGGPVFVEKEGYYEIFGITSYVNIDGYGVSCRADGGNFVIDLIHYRGWIMATAKKWLGYYPGDETDDPICGNGIVEADEECDNSNDSECLNCRKNSKTVQENSCIEILECTNNCKKDENCFFACLYSGDKEAVFKLDKAITCILDSCDNPTQSCQNKYCKKEVEECEKDKPAKNSSFCGNNKIEYGEMCDDGNSVSGDGCDNSCQREKATGEFHSCLDSMICFILESLGFETLQNCEKSETEDGVKILGALSDCLTKCNDEPYYCLNVKCGEYYKKCINHTTCGNGIVEADETCDDGNRKDDDSCDSKCGVKSKKSSSGCSVTLI